MGKGRNFKGEDQEMRQNEADELVLLELLLQDQGEEKRVVGQKAEREQKEEIRGEGSESKTEAVEDSVARESEAKAEAAEDSVAKDREEKITGAEDGEITKAGKEGDGRAQRESPREVGRRYFEVTKRRTGSAGKGGSDRAVEHEAGQNAEERSAENRRRIALL